MLVMLYSLHEECPVARKHSADANLLLDDSLVQSYGPIAVYGFNWVWNVRNVFVLPRNRFSTRSMT